MASGLSTALTAKQLSGFAREAHAKKKKITCSTAEWFSPSFIEYLRSVNSSVPEILNMTPVKLCAMDPVNVSLHFHKKWDSIFNKLILSKETPIFGEVIDFFWRNEYQARGAPHVHCVLWIKDAPVIGRNTSEEIRKYIEQICTCEKPNADSSPTLRSLVDQFQTHKCNTYCTKTYKKGSRFYKKCRFGFPRPVRSSIELNDVIDCPAVNRDSKKHPRKRIYNLARDKDEACINDHNPALLLANQANVDVQYIGHLGSRLPYYITDYMTKHERAEQDDLWQEIFPSGKTLGSNAMSYLLKSVKSRQVGANEAADRLLGHKLYSKSRQMRYADLQPSEKAKRILKPVAELKQIVDVDPESQDIFLQHWVLDIYSDRPEKLENLSLFELLGWYEKDPGRKDPNLESKSGKIFLRRRQFKPYLVTHQIVDPNQSEKNQELYYYYLLKLFKPWRDEKNLALPDMSYRDTFAVESERFPEMVSYHEKNTNVMTEDETIEKAAKERAAELDRQGNDLDDIEDHQNALQGCVTDHATSAMQDLIVAQTRLIDSSENVHQKYGTLNVDQKRVVDNVLQTILANETVRLIVSGQGGTGKSRVIEVISRLVCESLKHVDLPCVVAAPTGLSAFNVNDTTIHRALCLPVEHGKPANYCRLNEEQLSVLRRTLRGLKLLIVDEVSMISSITLLYILHLRLVEIMANNDYFGGVSIVFFADFLQLPLSKEINFFSLSLSSKPSNS